MKKTTLLSIATATVTTLALTACSQADKTSGSAKDAVMKATKNQLIISKQFNAIDNLEGFVVKAKTGQGQSGLIYADKDGKYVVFGNIISADGKNISQANYKQYIQSGIAEKALKNAASTSWFMTGSKTAPHQAYFIFEPNCSVCHLLYKALQPAIKSGQLAVRWIPVAFLRPDSIGKAAAIIQATDQGKALAEDEAKFILAKDEGSIKPLAKKAIKADTQKKLQANTKYMMEHGFNGTPVLIYQDKASKAAVMSGLPRSKAAIKQLIDGMSKLPA